MNIINFKLDQFEGPLNLLLELIKKNKLDITEISLAEISEQFISIMRYNNLDLHILVDFLVVASQLLYIKSRLLLPEEDDNDENEYDLEEHLKIYKEFAEASLNIAQILSRKDYLYGIKKRKKDKEIIKFRPPQGIKKEDLRNYFALSLKSLASLNFVDSSVMEKKITLEEKIKHLESVLCKYTKITFNTIKKLANSKSEVLISFLALLELVKQGKVITKQDQPFSDIIIKKNI